MIRSGTTRLIAAMLTLSAAGCVTAPSVTETRASVCPRPMNATELRRAADALDALPRGASLDYLAQQLDRLDVAARICRGNRT